MRTGVKLGRTCASKVRAPMPSHRAASARVMSGLIGAPRSRTSAPGGAEEPRGRSRSPEPPLRIALAPSHEHPERTLAHLARLFAMYAEL